MIFEDEDELGYWIGERPVNPWASVSSLIVCNDILTMQERAEIESAALNAHEGRDFAAERCRRFAGYGGLGFRLDADYVR